MQLVWITALGVGAATLIGSLIGFALKNIPHKLSDALLGFAAGVMLAASFTGLILPAVEMGGAHGVWIVGVGLLLGAAFLSVVDRLVPHMHSPSNDLPENEQILRRQRNKTYLFVMAIAIHNLPEGLAAGIGFGTNDISSALTVAAGIALQNLPEGMIIISPLLLAGVSKKKTLGIAVATGLVEVIGTLLGYFAASISTVVLPLLLAFAGGTMLYVISDEMIPETHSHGNEKSSTFALILGILLMLVMDFYL